MICVITSSKRTLISDVIRQVFLSYDLCKLKKSCLEKNSFKVPQTHLWHQAQGIYLKCV